MATEKDILTDILEAENSAIDTFSTIWENAKRNQEIQSLQHWTEQEDKRIRSQGRIPYVFDEISRPVNILLGTQRDNRFDIKFYARNAEDELRAEVMNAVWKYYADLYDFQSTESDVFQDGIINGFGAYGIDIFKEKNPLGDLRVSRIPYDELIWDTNFRQYDLSDAYWLARMRFYRRSELKRYFPDKTDLIEKAGQQTDWAGMKIKKKLLWYRPDKDLIATREFYEKNWKRKYYIWQQGFQEPEEIGYSTKEEAEAEIANRVQKAIQAVNNGMLLPEQMPMFEVLDIDTRIVTRKVVLINGVLEDQEEYQLNDYPYTLFFPNFNDGKYWSFIDRIKDQQLFINRYMAQMDNWIGTAAKGLLWIDPRSSKKERDDIEAKFAKTGGTISTKYKPELIQGSFPPFQMFQMVGDVRTNLQNNVGGANGLGLKQTASESGRAVLARQSQAGLDSFISLDNLRRTKQNLGEKIAWYLTNVITEPRKIKIVGDQLTMQAMNMGLLNRTGIAEPSMIIPDTMFVNINTHPQNTIAGLEVDIITDEAPHSVTKNQGILGAITDIGKAFPNMPPPPPNVIIELSGVPESLKREWVGMIEQMQNSNKEAPMKISAQFKDLPADAQMQLLQKLGIETDVASNIVNTIAKNPHLADKGNSLQKPELTQRELEVI